MTLASVAQIRGCYQNRKTPVSMAASQTTARPRRHALEEELTSLRREHDDLRHAVYAAAQVQRKLCGTRHFRAGSYELASEMFPVSHLSGDFINVFRMKGDLILAIGDIAGKGLAAAMWFTYMIAMTRRQILRLGDPAEALSALNNELMRAGLEVPLTTVFLARVNLESGDLVYCNAGHPPTLLIRANDEIQELGIGGPILGAISNAPFTNGVARLWPGSVLFAYSDGILECRNESGTEFGSKRLMNTVRTFYSSSPSGLLFSVLGAIENFAGNQRRQDDIALTVLHRFGSSGT
jgi:serine phosphatase RsbU (regulator of sigma subunit)